MSIIKKGKIYWKVVCPICEKEIWDTIVSPDYNVKERLDAVEGLYTAFLNHGKIEHLSRFDDIVEFVPLKWRPKFKYFIGY